ncbi:MAG: DNA-primase RepB domain-containing protein [Bryobacteraceae bacterium]
MGCESFEVGLFNPGAPNCGPAMLPRVWDADALLRSIPWLRKENRDGRNIFCRPRGEHDLSLVDDLSLAAVAEMKKTGFQPALVVETSPDNFQAWLNHGRSLPRLLSTAVAKELAARFGGDSGAADWRHFGRLAGFTNRKEKYRDASTGLFPFVHLVESSRRQYDESVSFLQMIEKRLAVEEEKRTAISVHLSRSSAPIRSQLKAIESFRADGRYAGDGTREDLAYAIYALAHGVDLAEVDSAIRSRDLSHKGTEKRQNDYVNRTIQKALHAIEGQGIDRGR